MQVPVARAGDKHARLWMLAGAARSRLVRHSVVGSFVWGCYVGLTVAELNALYDEHARDLLGYLARRCGDSQLAMDLLGATFLAAFENRERCRARHERERVAWIYRIAANAFVDHLRRGAAEQRALARIRSDLRALSPTESQEIERLSASDELEQRVVAAFGELSDEQRAAIWLRVVEERPYPEVSRALGLSDQAARARVSRGLRALRRGSEPGKEAS
jgi:RNA polymerase sigma factor (sigma-70 family)